MPDPVSWLVVEPGWRVVDARGEEIGRVERVVGDENADIFEGIDVREGLLKESFVSAERIASIVEGEIRLS
jgi:uncharacterized protein YrrD